MQRSEFSWGKDAGEKIFAVDWRSEGEPKAVIALVHGLGEHIGRYEHVAKAFTDSGYAVVGMDLPGHGRSAGKRGHAPYARIMDELDRLVREARERHPGKPVFLYAHSMGGAAALEFCIGRKPALRGLIVGSPLLRTAEPVAPWKLLVAKSLGLVFPSVTMPNGLDPETVSRDAEIVRIYRTDPLGHSMVSARTGLDMMKAGPHILANAASITIPVLYLQGTADGIVDPTAAGEFAAKAGKNLTLKVFEGLYHELHNEPERAEVFRCVLGWMDALLT